MIKLFLLGVLSLTFTAHACKLPPKTKLIIGCTYQCNFAYKFRLSMVALKLGYSIQVVDLLKEPEWESKVDGVLIPGGVDIDPSYYLDQVSTDLQTYTRAHLNLANLSEEGKIRDSFEYDFLKRYTSEDKFKTLPVLGVCRGMQMMTVAQGIPLFLDIKTELGIKNRRYVFDKVEVRSSSLMKTLYGNRKILGYKNHHQGLRVPYWKSHMSEYPGVKVSAFSHDDKIAEAIEYQNRPALGVQYHPEMSGPRATNPILKWFLTKSCENRITR